MSYEPPSQFCCCTLYLCEQVTELLGISSENLSLKYGSGPTPSIADADIKPELHELMHDLVLHIHETEPDIEKGILIFLPTYQSLEKQWSLLKPLSSCFKVHILHSSIDTEKALMAMKIWKSHRKVSILILFLPSYYICYYFSQFLQCDFFFYCFCIFIIVQ